MLNGGGGGGATGTPFHDEHFYNLGYPIFLLTIYLNIFVKMNTCKEVVHLMQYSGLFS